MQTLSTQKIVVLLAFVCGALMTFIFIYHMRQHVDKPPYSAENSTMFAVAHDIKSFELVSGNNTQFTQKDFLNHWTLLFFGFSHCSSVCPTTLDMLNKVYEQLHPTYPNLQVVLISLDPERDTAESLANYVKDFNPAFLSATGKIQEIRKLQSQLGIFSAKDNTSSDDNYQLQHTSSILLINPQGKWSGLFKYGMSPKEFNQEFGNAIKYLIS